MVHKGFYESFVKVRKYIFSEIESFPKLTFTGHSLGGAIATLAALECSLLFKEKKIFPKPFISCITFGCPKVGNSNFVKFYNENVDETIRVVNKFDLVTFLPLMLEHVCKPVILNTSLLIFFKKYKIHSINIYVKKLKKENLKI